jgi:hypothetical protein
MLSRNWEWRASAGLTFGARDHAGILTQEAGKSCAWPECSQTMPFRSLCQYHEKRVRGIIGAYRG